MAQLDDYPNLINQGVNEPDGDEFPYVGNDLCELVSC